MYIGPIFNILVRTHGGQVSLLKNLDEKLARETMQRLDCWGNPWSDAWIDAAIQARREGRSSYAIRAACMFTTDVDHLDCWASDGSTLNVWPKPSGYDAHVAEMEATYDERMAANAKHLRAHKSALANHA
jgi:hypothetical protein